MVSTWDDDDDAASFLKQVKNLRDDVSIGKEELSIRLKDAAVENPALFVKLVDEMISTYEKRSNPTEKSLSQCKSTVSNKYRNSSRASSRGRASSNRSLNTHSHGKPRTSRSSSLGRTKSNNNQGGFDYDFTDDDASHASRSVISMGEGGAVEVEFALDDGASQVSDLSYASRVVKMFRRMRPKTSDNNSVVSGLSRDVDDVYVLRESRPKKNINKKKDDSPLLERAKIHTATTKISLPQVKDSQKPLSTQTKQSLPKEKGRERFLRRFFRKSTKKQIQQVNTGLSSGKTMFHKEPVGTDETVLSCADSSTLKHCPSGMSSVAESTRLDIQITPCSFSKSLDQQIGINRSESAIDIIEDLSRVAVDHTHHTLDVVRSYDGGVELDQIEKQKKKTMQKNDSYENSDFPEEDVSIYPIKIEPKNSHSNSASVLGESKKYKNRKLQGKVGLTGLQIYSPRNAKDPEGLEPHSVRSQQESKVKSREVERTQYVESLAVRDMKQFENKPRDQSVSQDVDSQIVRNLKRSKHKIYGPPIQARSKSKEASGPAVQSNVAQVRQQPKKLGGPNSSPDVRSVDNSERKAKSKKTVRIQSPHHSRKKEGYEDERSMSSMTFLTDFLDNLDDSLMEAIDNNKALRNWFDSDEKIESLRRLIKKRNREVPTWLSEDWIEKSRSVERMPSFERSISRDFSLGATSFDMLAPF